MKVKYVIATHGHEDHVETLAELAGKLGAETVAHESSDLPTDIRVRDGDELKIGGASVRVIHTPGHTRDSICLFDGRDLFTGRHPVHRELREDGPAGRVDQRALPQPPLGADGSAEGGGDLSGSTTTGRSAAGRWRGDEEEPDSSSRGT